MYQKRTTQRTTLHITKKTQHRTWANRQQLYLSNSKPKRNLHVLSQNLRNERV